MRHALAIVLFAGASLGLARAALAQDADPPPDDEPAASPDDGESQPAVESAEVEAPEPEPEPQPEPPELVEAREHFATGELLFREESYEAALNEYRRAYEILEGNPRQHVMLFNIGLCYERLFRYDLALESYRRYLDEGGTEEANRADVEASLRALENLLGRVTITTDVEVEVWSQDRLLGPGPGTVLLPAGNHVLSLRATGYQTVQLEVQVAAREEIVREVTMSVVFEGISPVPFVVLASTAFVTLGVAAGFGAHALSLSSGVQEQDTVVAEDLAPIRDAALAHDILLGLGATLAAVSTVLLLLTDWDGPSDDVSIGVGDRAVAFTWSRRW